LIYTKFGLATKVLCAASPWELFKDAFVTPVDPEELLPWDYTGVTVVDSGHPRREATGRSKENRKLLLQRLKTILFK